LYPDETGGMASGSGIPDPEDHLHIGDGIHTPLLFFYSAAGGVTFLSEGKKWTQHLAASSDGGYTLEKRGEVLPHIIELNRDPKVVYAEELNAYVMALYMDKETYALFTSADLLHWEELQRIDIPGTAECPDIYPLVCENTGEKLWILSGASDKYLVGHLNNTGFVPVQDVLALRTKSMSYAAQTFSGVENRTIRTAWSAVTAAGCVFCGQMLLPTEMGLTKVDGIYRLKTMPVKELELLRKETITHKKTVTPQDSIVCPLNGGAYEINLVWAEDADAMKLTLYDLELQLLPHENQLVFDKQTLPLRYGTGRNLRLIVDTLSLEIFADDGRVFSVLAHRTDLEKRLLTLEGNADVVLSVSPLKQIW